MPWKMKLFLLPMLCTWNNLQTCQLFRKLSSQGVSNRRSWVHPPERPCLQSIELTVLLSEFFHPEIPSLHCKRRATYPSSFALKFGHIHQQNNSVHETKPPGTNLSASSDLVFICDRILSQSAPSCSNLWKKNSTFQNSRKLLLFDNTSNHLSHLEQRHTAHLYLTRIHTSTAAYLPAIVVVQFGDFFFNFDVDGILQATTTKKMFLVNFSRSSQTKHGVCKMVQTETGSHVFSVVASLKAPWAFNSAIVSFPFSRAGK